MRLPAGTHTGSVRTGICPVFEIGERVEASVTAGGNHYQPIGVVDNVCATFRMANGAAVSWVQGDAHCPPVTSKFFMQLFAPGRSVTLMDRFCTLVYAEAGKEPSTF